MRRECRERLPPSPLVSDLDMHHGTCVTHVPCCMPGSLLSSSLSSRWRGKRSRHSWRTRNTLSYVSGKRPIVWCGVIICPCPEFNSDPAYLKHQQNSLESFPVYIFIQFLCRQYICHLSVILYDIILLWFLYHF